MNPPEQFMVARSWSPFELRLDAVICTIPGGILSSERDWVKELQAVFLTLLKALVDEPEAVMLEVVTSEAGTVFHVRVSKRDLGKIIGKQGRTAQAIRLLLATASNKYKQRFELSIEEVNEF